MNRALVIKTYGDSEIAGAIVNGIVRKTPRPESLRRVAMHQHTPEEWAAMITKARYDYGQDRTHGRLYEAVLVAWAMFWFDLRGWYEYFRDINRGGIAHGEY